MIQGEGASGYFWIHFKATKIKEDLAEEGGSSSGPSWIHQCQIPFQIGGE